jgi:hypothetical protein
VYGEGVIENGNVATLYPDRYGRTESLVWSDHDVYTPNGALYLKASDPVPVTNPQDFYIVNNGLGQKQDLYLRVGGQWVKQDAVAQSE